MRVDALVIFAFVSALAVAALFSRRHKWLRSAAVWTLTLSLLSTIAIAFLFGSRLAVARFERSGGQWTNELAAAFSPVVHNMLHPFYLVLSVWIVLLAMLALKREPPGEA